MMLMVVGVGRVDVYVGYVDVVCYVGGVCDDVGVGVVAVGIYSVGMSRCVAVVRVRVCDGVDGCCWWCCVWRWL